MSEIRFYRATGKYGFLSNLYPSPFPFEERVFPCAEAAYQFGKPRQVAVAEWIISAPKPHLMAIAAHGLFVFDVRENWNDIKVERMKQVLAVKFGQHFWTLGKQLIGTLDADLIEESKSDAFWGVGKKGTGKNMLGVLLMETRSSLRNEFAALNGQDSLDTLIREVSA